MTDNEIVKEFVDRQRQSNILKMEQELLKDELRERLQGSDREKFSCEYGTASYKTHMRNQFNQKMAKDILTEDQIGNCTEQKEVTVMKIISPEALEKQKDFLNMKG